MIPMLYSDDDILIIDKPYGLAVQPGAGVGVSVIEAVERDFGFRPWLVHRLDKDTAGCLVLARSSRAAAEVSRMLASRGVRKTYRAVVFGTPIPAEGEFTDAVRVKGESVDALTRYRVLESARGFSVVEAELGTGRMHQIRQHFADAGFPILADDKYGDFKRNKLAQKEWGARKLFLYAFSLSLPFNPPLGVCAGIPSHFYDFFSRTGLCAGQIRGEGNPAGGDLADSAPKVHP